MRITTYLTIILCLCTNILNASSFDMTILEEVEFELFLDTFNYQTYFEKVNPSDIDFLESDRQTLNLLGIDGNQFIWKAFEFYTENLKLDFDNNTYIVKEAVRLAEIMFHSQNYLPDSVYIYTTVSDLIFETIAKSLEGSIESGEFDKNDFHIRYMASRLCDNQYCIDISTSNWEKLLYHIKEGNWAYIWDKSTGTYLKEFLIALISGTLVFILFVWGIISIYKKRKKKNDVQNAISN
jgi:hypothetical protein